jgi:hypothetical protein
MVLQPYYQYHAFNRNQNRWQNQNLRTSLGTINVLAQKLKKTLEGTGLDLYAELTGGKYIDIEAKKRRYW